MNTESSSGECVSPGKAVDLQMKNLEQLRFHFLMTAFLVSLSIQSKKETFLSFLHKLNVINSIMVFIYVIRLNKCYLLWVHVF